MNKEMSEVRVKNMNQAEIKRTVKSVLRGACALVSPLWSSVSTKGEGEARDILNTCWEKRETTTKASNTLGEITCDVQIIVPAYNVERYLEACMESILSQKSTYSFHVMLVEDGAKDGTPAICDRYADHPQVTVIHQKNRGLSGARNRGMETLYGRYVFFVDSDDVLCEGAIQGLMQTAEALDCDIVEGGAYYLTEGNRTVAHRYARDQVVKDPYSRLHGHAWGKLFRRELLADRCFPEGYWYEDSLISFLLFGQAGRVGVSAQMAYGYRINQEGIVKASVGKPRAVETYYITELLLRERQEAGLPVDDAFARFLLLQIRLNQLRLSSLDEAVQESAFVLTCGLLAPLLPGMEKTGKEKNLIRALRNRDFGRFRMCCRFF